jgi:hypothetical protein
LRRRQERYFIREGHSNQSRGIIGNRQQITPLFMRDTDRILRIENIAKGVATPCSSPDDSIFAPPVTTLWGKKA